MSCFLVRVSVSMSKCVRKFSLKLLWNIKRKKKVFRSVGAEEIELDIIFNIRPTKAREQKIVYITSIQFINKYIYLYKYTILYLYVYKYIYIVVYSVHT